MKGPADVGAEIDLEIASYQLKGQSKPTYQMQLPIWKPSGQKGKDAIVLKKDGSELTATTANGCREDKGNPAMGGWAYTYDGYDPRRWTKYKLEWFEDYIRWYSEGLERATFRKEKDSTYPSTPLVSAFAMTFRHISRTEDALPHQPMAAGPWAVSKESNPEVGWAGAMDWKANPNPSMSLKNVRIAGCRAKPS